MAFLLGFGAATLGGFYAIDQKDKETRAIAELEAKREREKPQSADWTTRGALAAQPLPPQPEIIQSTDLRGVPVYYVNTGSGSYAAFYAAPDGLEVVKENLPIAH